MPKFEVVHTDRSGARHKTEVDAADKYAAQEGFAKGSIQSLRQIPAVEQAEAAEPDQPDDDQSADTQAADAGASESGADVTTEPGTPETGDGPAAA